MLPRESILARADGRIGFQGTRTRERLQSQRGAIPVGLRYAKDQLRFSNDGTVGAGCVGVDGVLGGVDGLVGGVDGVVGGFDGLVGGVDGVVGGFDGLVGGVDGVVGGFDGLVGGVDGLVGGVDGLVGGVDGLVGGVDGSVGGVAGSLGGVEGSVAGVAGLLGGAAGLLGVSGLLGGVNGLLGEGPTGELHADIRAVVATAIEITRRNRIGTRLTPLRGPCCSKWRATTTSSASVTVVAAGPMI